MLPGGRGKGVGGGGGNGEFLFSRHGVSVALDESSGDA